VFASAVDRLLFIAVPAAFGLWALRQPIVTLVYGERFLPAHRRNFRELVDDEPGEITAVRLRVDSGEEFGEVRAHDPVEHARGRRSRHVDSSHAIGP